jgi:hypothetical protein
MNVGYWLLNRSDASMDADDFRRIALSLEGAEESSHMGQPDFRVGGRIFATLASEDKGYGNLMLTVEQQAAFVQELPEVFVPIAGGWGRMGMTHIRLAVAKEEVLEPRGGQGEPRREDPSQEMMVDCGF